MSSSSPSSQKCRGGVTCKCDTKDKHDDSNFIYVESPSSKMASRNHTLNDEADSVWYCQKPKFIENLHEPLISARKLQIIRAELMGQVKIRECPGKPKTLTRETVSTTKKKSAMKFLSRTVFDDE